MQRHLRNLPIKHKLMAITMTISGVALLLACAAFTIYEQDLFRRTMARDFAILADMFGDNVASGLAFNDSASIEQTLRTLEANRRIIAACVYDTQGAVVGTYQRAGPGAVGRFEFPAARPTGQFFGPNRLDSFKTIELAGENIGVVYIGADLGELRERAWRYLAIVGILLAGCLLVALLLASRLQRLISQPIVDLAQTVATVTTNKNYSVRANQQSDDELGRLIGGFNDMLGQIQVRDTALQNARDNLETRVEERTRELQRENAERKRAESELAKSLSVLHATIESTIDGILVVDLRGRLTTYNRVFTEMWRIPREILDTRDDNRALSVAIDQLREPETFMAKVHDLYARPAAESFDVLELKDGRIFERYSQPHRIGPDIAGRVWCFRDITERKQAEAKLADTHQQLLASSRQAGMAEVATGVLHNVGNVLNSLNVSSAIIATSVRQSRTDSLAGLAALLREHAADLAGFLAHDPKGRRLPELVTALAGHFGEERKRLLLEIKSLQKSIDHIRDIVSMQQAYATVGTNLEQFEAAALLDDALHMNSATLARHEVQLVREYRPVPPVLVDKGKVIQILINLIRNARHACDEGHQADGTPKVITVRIDPGDTGFVRLSVHDNGIGISADRLPQIFRHGYTTKAAGHGFGLHTSALAARELKGRLTVHSDGPGLGATFVLSLPVAFPRETDPAGPA